jgi:hypothetical protein
MHNERGRKVKTVDIFDVSTEEQNAGVERLEAVIKLSKCVTIPAL